MVRNDWNPRSGGMQQVVRDFWVFPTDQFKASLYLFVKHFVLLPFLLVFHNIFNFLVLVHFLDSFSIWRETRWLEGTIYVVFLDDSTNNLIGLNWERNCMLSWNWYLFLEHKTFLGLMTLRNELFPSQRLSTLGWICSQRTNSKHQEDSGGTPQKTN